MRRALEARIGAILFPYIVLFLLSPIVAAESDEFTPEQIAFFENKIRPVLATSCYECHGAEKQEGDLRLDTYKGIMQGGKSGVLISTADPASSLLITAIKYQNPDLQMPPDGQLSKEVVADFVLWLASGAAHPDGKPGGAKSIQPRKSSIDIESERGFWAFQPLHVSEPDGASSRGWAETRIDQYLFEQGRAVGLSVNQDADRRTLIRRLAIDLLGLPPTAEEIDEYVNDASPNAWERLVDRYLASPRYGERWGRHWLDVARYADSNGLDENICHGNAWRYRDYVVNSFNSDKPYSDFVVEHLAGDLLPKSGNTEVDQARIVATGYLVIGPKVLAEVDELKMEMDIVDEQIDTLGKTFLGMTFGCARCHDHKFDPVRTDDYYSLVGIFRSTYTMESFTKIAKWNETPIPSEADQVLVAKYEQELAAKRAEAQAALDEAKRKLTETLPAGTNLPENFEEQFPAETKQKLVDLRKQVSDLEKSPPVVSTAMAVKDGKIANAVIHPRGNHLAKGSEVPRGIPAVLDRKTLDIKENSSGRLELAEWIASEENALAARVIANRIWYWRFGKGIVGSPDNFGVLGEKPSNPALLDYVAETLIRHEFSIKSLHREMLQSHVYRLSSESSEINFERDPDNRALMRYPFRRMDVEAIRDSSLAAAGELDLTMGGTLVQVANRAFFFDHTSKDDTKYDSNRRAIYMPVVRNNLYDMFQLFDYTDAGVPSGERASTIVASQALFSLNSELELQVAERYAQRVLREQQDPESRVREVYLSAFGRVPSAIEASQALQFVEGFKSNSKITVEVERELAAWTAFCQAVLISNEFVYVR